MPRTFTNKGTKLILFHDESRFCLNVQEGRIQNVQKPYLQHPELNSIFQQIPSGQFLNHCLKMPLVSKYIVQLFEGFLK